MKKSLVVSALIFGASSLFALSIDEASVKPVVTGYKTDQKIAVPMTFKEAKFSFKATNGSVKEVLEGATALIDLNKVDTNKNPLRDKNMRDKFFAKLNSKEAKALINAVEGDDKAGKLKTTITFNGIQRDVEMGYVVENGKLVAKTSIDIKDYKATAAFDAFRTDTTIKGLHGNNTWSEVEIGFEVNVK